MGNKRFWHEHILRVLSSHDCGGAADIMDWMEKEYGKKIAKPNLYDNMKFLVTHDYVTPSSVSDLKGSRKITVWKLAKKHHEEQLRKRLVEVIDKIDPFDFPTLESPLGIPSVILGCEAKSRPEYPFLVKAVIERFKLEVENIIETEFEASDGEALKLILATLVWSGYKDLTWAFVDWVKRACTHVSVSEEEHRFARKLSSVKNLSDLHKKLQSSEVFIRHRGIGYIYVAMWQIKRICDMMSPLMWRLLDHAVEAMDLPFAESVKGTKEEAIAFVSQRHNMELFEKFIDKLRKNSFILVAMVNCAKVDELPSMLSIQFSMWMDSLRSGQLDDREQIFREGVKNLLWFKKQLAYVLKKGKDPSHMTRKPQYRLDIWDLVSLAADHPRGKDLNFYDEIYKAIDERRNVIRSKPPPESPFWNLL